MAGRIPGSGPVDSMPRLYVRRSSTSPLFVVVGKPLDSILSLWRTEAFRLGAIMMALITFVLAVTLFLAREIGRRAKAEDRLEELATTDALTGLKNRRKFDAEIDAEWRRAARHQLPIALLMIDADHFKAYNDSFGHQAGDQVLVGIAICISDSLRRAGDCAARYGGEEFAVLLPGLAATEAAEVAETIRLKVRAMVRPADSHHRQRQHRGREPDAAAQDGMVAALERRRQARSTRPKRAAATSRCWRASRSFRWWRSRHFFRYFCISARKASRKSGRARPKATLARRKPALEPQSCRSPSNSTP